MIWASADAGQVGHTDQQRLQLNQHPSETMDHRGWAVDGDRALVDCRLRALCDIEPLAGCGGHIVRAPSFGDRWPNFSSVPPLFRMISEPLVIASFNSRACPLW